MVILFMKVKKVSLDCRASRGSGAVLFGKVGLDCRFAQLRDSFIPEIDVGSALHQNKKVGLDFI